MTAPVGRILHLEGFARQRRPKGPSDKQRNGRTRQLIPDRREPLERKLGCHGRHQDDPFGCIGTGLRVPSIRLKMPVDPKTEREPMTQRPKPPGLKPKLDYAFTVRIRFERVHWVRPSNTGMTRAAVYLDDGEFAGAGDFADASFRSAAAIGARCAPTA